MTPAESQKWVGGCSWGRRQESDLDGKGFSREIKLQCMALLKEIIEQKSTGKEQLLLAL